MTKVTRGMRHKVYSGDNLKQPEGMVKAAVAGLSGSIDLNTIAGRYSKVRQFFDVEPSPLPPGAVVIGDKDENLYQYKGTGDFTIDPSLDDFNGYGESDNWINLTVRTYLNVSIERSVPVEWNEALAVKLQHPCTVIGSDGNLYDSVKNGDLFDDPTNGNTANWLLFLDTSKGIIPTGIIMPFPNDDIPAGWLLCDDTLYDKDVYSDLYEVLKNGGSECIYGETASTFHIPDLRGCFLRGTDHGAGRDPGANGVVFTAQADITKSYLTGVSPALSLGEPYETGMELVAGAEFGPGTVITELDQGANIIYLNVPPITDGAITGVAVSRTDRGDGVTGDVVGTFQNDTFRSHPLKERLAGHKHSTDRRDGNDNSPDLKPYTAKRVADQHSRNTGGYRVKTVSGGGNTETHPVNIFQNFMIKT